jgi:nucleoside-diphosphate-sugar epimerase
MRLFITGATGFIGRHLLAQLGSVSGLEIGVLTSGEQPLPLIPQLRIQGRLENLTQWRGQLKAWQPDACIHLAWYAEPGQYLYSPQNIALLTHSLDLLQTLIEAGCQTVLMMGSVAEYDTDTGYLSEDSPTHPQTIYATAKLSLSWMAQRMALDANMRLIWARLFYLYGPQEEPRRVVAALIQTLLRGQSFPTTPGEQVRDYLHVHDVASALWHLVESQQQGVYNICSGYPVTLRDLVLQIATLVGRPDLVQLGALPYRQWEPMFICGNNHKLKATGWQAHYSLETGLRHTFDWWKTQAL